MKRVNYYFSLKNQINGLVDQVKGDKNSNLQLRENLTIAEEDENEEDASSSMRKEDLNQIIRERTKT